MDLKNKEKKSLKNSKKAKKKKYFFKGKIQKSKEKISRIFVLFFQGVNCHFFISL